ncbi:DUF4190 domain-containing protein [Micromonospora sp. NPDC049523]|uniref:DUF4190 domain-containing protein n=1 Tax=Micromonospora sp. NPDC049523 TaxID=3155921 RepID=UPI00343BC14E
MHPNQPRPLPQQMYVPVMPLVVTVRPPTSGLAVTSLVLGIFGVLGGWCLLGIPCILAVIFGHFALYGMRDGRVGGRGLAIAGLVLGYLVVAPAIVLTMMGGLGALIGSVERAEPAPAAAVSSCLVSDGTATVAYTVTNKSSDSAGYRIKVTCSSSYHSGLRTNPYRPRTMSR